MARRSYPPVPIKAFQDFVKTVRQLRRECPWDREQTHKSIRHSLIEETYEVVEALDTEDKDELRKELGDLLLHIAMHATIAEQAGEFTLRDVIRGVNEKLIRRHPHVFGSRKASTAAEVKKNWEELKMQEGRSSLLEGIPDSLPALLRALRVQERAAKVGFDWEHEDDVWKKVEEEVEEFRHALKRGNREEQEEELGDVLFALVNYSRSLHLNPEDALRQAIAKFTRRFRFIEQELKGGKSDVNAATLQEMDDLWNEAKKRGL